MTTRTIPRWLGALGALAVLGVTVWAGYLVGARLLSPRLAQVPAVLGLPTEAPGLGTDPATVPASSFPTVDPGVAATESAEAAIEATMPRIQLADAVSKVGRPDVLFVDARSVEEYSSAHIKGAISIPVGQVEARLSELPKDKEIIFYCA